MFAVPADRGALETLGRPDVADDRNPE